MATIQEVLMSVYNLVCLMKCKVDRLGSSGIKAAALYSMHIQHVSWRQHRHSTLVHIYVES